MSVTAASPSPPPSFTFFYPRLLQLSSLFTSLSILASRASPLSLQRLNPYRCLCLSPQSQCKVIDAKVGLRAIPPTTHAGTSHWTQRGCRYFRVGAEVHGGYYEGLADKQRPPGFRGFPWWRARIGALECSLWLCRDCPAGHPVCVSVELITVSSHRARGAQRQPGPFPRWERGGLPRLALNQRHL